MDRIQAYLNERARVRALDQEFIHSMNDKELRASDIAALLLAARQSAGAAGQEPVAWQVRRLTRLTDKPIQWEDCTKELYDATLATGRYAGYENGPRCEVRALCVADNETFRDMLTALQEVLATPGLQSGLQVMCAAAIAKATGRDVADVIKGV